MKKIKAHLQDKNDLNRTLIRISHEIIEKNPDLSQIAIVGIRTRGEIFTAQSIIQAPAIKYARTIPNASAPQESPESPQITEANTNKKGEMIKPLLKMSAATSRSGAW